VPGRRWAGRRVQRAGQRCSGTVGKPCSFRPVTIYSRSVKETAKYAHQSDFPVIIAADPDTYFLGLLDPDPLVRGTDPDPDPSIIKQKQREKP
jgi:hypothetical protein